MASELITSASKLRGFLATPSYLRLWFAGGIGNAMRWLELLVAGIFTYEVTHSTVLVALVTVARSLPMLFIGTIAGVVGEALNRKRLLLTQLFVMAVNSAVLCALAFSAQIRVWHIAVGGIAAGIVWAMELAVRRRMIGEVVAPDQVAPAVAFDSLTNSFARVLGPLAGGAAYQTLDSSSGNQRQEDSKNREAWVRRPADRRSVEWLGRRGGRRLRACWRVGDRGRGGDGSGCWRAGRRAACGRTKRAARPEPLWG